MREARRAALPVGGLGWVRERERGGFVGRVGRERRGTRGRREEEGGGRGRGGWGWGGEYLS